MFDDAGDVVILTRTEREQLLRAHAESGGQGFKAELDRDARVRNALNRFVDEAILRPNAAQRPIWASDPHWALVFHL
ncbi:MAG: hypothetical protein GTO63_05845, partial [Anaerolineae bacterium]|nr:hypothetical protein [Anaerolineae bacterium]NIN94494.1 hypothetical protein [Anaerolineae bacterium]NIQ77564.1 hypothetical protein [Anaerolineae bacterium]